LFLCQSEGGYHVIREVVTGILQKRGNGFRHLVRMDFPHSAAFSVQLFRHNLHR
jgi:uncharacterized membrane protein